MNQIKNFSRIALAKNAEHFQFHKDMLNVITEDFATAQKILPLRTSYVTLFDREDVAFATSRTLVDTAEIEAKDKVRDLLARYIYALVDAKTLSPKAEESAAATRLKVKLEPYWAANVKPYAENTALIDNMVRDMQTDDLAADVATLELTEVVSDLKTANDDFNAIYYGRSTEKESRSQVDKMSDIRPKVDKAYFAIADAINALYSVNALVTKDSATEAALTSVMDGVNAVILQLNETISRRTGGSSSSSSSSNDDDDSTTTDDNGGSSSTDDNGSSSDSGDDGSSSGDDSDVKF